MNIFKIPTRILQTMFFLNPLKNFFLKPVFKLRDIVKWIIVKSIVSIIKKLMKVSLLKNADTSNNFILKQFNAMIDKKADVKGISRELTFDLTLDNLMKEVYIQDKKGLVKGYGIIKNGLRNQIYNYITEKNFKNVKFILETVNGLLNTPASIAGLQFVKIDFHPETYIEDKKFFNIKVNVLFCLKTN